MIQSKTAHLISFCIGIIFLIIAFYLAFFVKNSNFYTSFALGSWLFFDFIDYKLNSTSILAFFYNHKHRHTFYLLFLVSFFACFTIDFIWGVQILKMWEWINYTPIQFVRMYIFMNISFVLSMYELYRVIHSLLRKYISEENLLHLRAPYDRKHIFYVATLLIGIIFLLSPLYVVVFKAYSIAEFILIFPFISITLITDSVTYFTHGQPVLEQLVRLNRLKVASVLFTIVSAFIFTEGLNLFGHEWKYLRMPFYNIQVLTVPLSVLIGWIPLILGLLSMVNMVKHLDYITTEK